MSKLKEMREAAGMTQKELAEKSGVSLRMVQYYEQGYKDIKKAAGEAVMKLAGAIGCQPADILGEAQDLPTYKQLVKIRYKTGAVLRQLAHYVSITEGSVWISTDRKLSDSDKMPYRVDRDKIEQIDTYMVQCKGWDFWDDDQLFEDGYDLQMPQ